MKLAILKQNSIEKKSPIKSILEKGPIKIFVNLVIILVLAILFLNLIVFRIIPKTELSFKINSRTAFVSFGREAMAKWERVGPNIIRFNGSWESGGGSKEQLKDLLKEPVDTIRIVDSSGGDVDEAIGDALLLISVNPRIVIEGTCLSSCANYLLPVAREIDIRNGAIIGYHGHVCELAPESSTCMKEKEFWSKLSNGELNSKLPNAFRVIENSLPYNSKAWMPAPEDFKKYGYPPMRFDWIPEANSIVGNGVYFAPLP